jgi:oligopeptide/dipeptide ABC transporter ATP-binding protein
MSELLSVRDLTLSFATKAGPLKVLRGIDLDLAADEVVALVGESGAGKSAFGKAILQLLSAPYVDSRASIAGSIRFFGEELLTASTERMRAVRARQIAMISQEALSGLNPVMRIGAQIAEAARAADPSLGAADVHRIVCDMLVAVGFADAEKRTRDYPHQLSGGQRQRVMLALAAVRKPQVLIADEPTTALDVSVQARVLALLADLQRESGMAMLFITHDLGVVANIADRVAVMYAGQIVETGSVAEVFTRPRHPYSAGLISALPEAPRDHPRLAGNPPDLRSLGRGCAFMPRCRHASATCAQPPPVQTFEGGARAQCWRPLP